MKIDLRDERLSDYKDSFGLHYNSILACLSTYFNDSVIVELGTSYGIGTSALAYNKSNTIYTYDIVHKIEAANLFEKEDFKNVNYIIGNCIEGNWSDTRHQRFGQSNRWSDTRQYKTDKEIFLSSKIIFMDIDPAEGNIKGEQEDKVLKFLISNNWKGIMVCDDIGTDWIDEFRDVQYSTLPIRKWWDSIDLPTFKIINKYSSPTGTGIICFDNQEVIYTSLTKDEEEHVVNKFCQDPANWTYSPTQVPIDRFEDGSFEVGEGRLKGVTGTWEETMLVKVVNDVGIYDNDIATFQTQFDKNGIKIVPRKILILKTWAGELTMVGDWGQVRRIRK